VNRARLGNLSWKVGTGSFLTSDFEAINTFQKFPEKHKIIKLVIRCDLSGSKEIFEERKQASMCEECKKLGRRFC